MSDHLLPSGQWLKDRLSTRWVGKSEIIYEEEIPSTNTLLKELARQGAPAGTVAVCDFQSAGRGRLQRVWKAAAGETLPVSLLLKPRLTPEQIPLCTLGAAVAASQAIEQVCPGLKAGIKWPNDVVIGGRKCVGILCEGAFDPEGRLCVIMGVGFNGNQREFPTELSASATSLFLEKQRCDPAAAPVVLRELLAAFLEAVEKVIDRLEEGGLSAILPEYRARSVTIGSTVRVIAPTEEYIGQAEGMDDAGALLVRDASGSLRVVVCGDVSVRGLMGYTPGAVPLDPEPRP